MGTLTEIRAAVDGHAGICIWSPLSTPPVVKLLSIPAIYLGLVERHRGCSET
jgi:hypothetical protein